MLWKCSPQYAGKFGKLRRGHRTGKCLLSFQSQRKAKKRNECLNNNTSVLISHASKIMLKIFQARLQQYVNGELPDVQTGFRKGKESRDKISNICWIIVKTMDFRKTSTFASLTMLNHLTVWIITNCDGNTTPPYLPPEKFVCRTRSNS